MASSSESRKNDFCQKCDKDEYENLAQKRLVEEQDKEKRDDQRNMGMSMRVECLSLDSVKKSFEVNRNKMEEKQKEDNFEESMKELSEKEEEAIADVRLKRKRKRNRKRKRRAEEDLELEVDEELVRVMGFSSFGGSKKNN